MKSNFISILPFAGLAVAASNCTRSTVTHTTYEKVYKTVNAVDASTKAEACSMRSTITSTAYEKVYVTVTPGAAEDISTTSIFDTTTTVIVHSSGAPYTNVSTSVIYPSASSSDAPAYPTLTVLPSTKVEYSSLAYTPVPQSEAAQSYEAAKSSATAAPVSTSESEAPAQPTYAAAPKPSSKSAAPAVPTYAAEPAKALDVSTAAAGSKRGEATFYGGNVSGGMCSFTGYTIPSGIFGTALSDSNWSKSANCGACVSVTGPTGTKITAMIVDQCPGCGPNHLDLFPDAFKQLADPSKGVIPVSWDIVPCGITTPIVLKNKEGTSKYWFSMQVMNSNVPVTKLEVSTDGGKSWKATERKDYNYFENPAGFGADSVDVKVTSTSGSSIVIKGVSIAANSKKTAGSNFA